MKGSFHQRWDKNARYSLDEKARRSKDFAQWEYGMQGCRLQSVGLLCQ
jgi:hypothetical protein